MGGGLGGTSRLVTNQPGSATLTGLRHLTCCVQGLVAGLVCLKTVITQARRFKLLLVEELERKPIPRISLGYISVFEVQTTAPGYCVENNPWNSPRFLLATIDLIVPTMNNRLRTPLSAIRTYSTAFRGSIENNVYRETNCSE